MDTQATILDTVRIDNRHLVLISENRVSFIRDVSDDEIGDVCAEELRAIAAHINTSTASIPLGPSIAFMPTFDCNLRCIYCYAKGGEDKASLSLATAKNAIEWVKRKTKNSNTVPLTIYFVGGGEPFMNFRVMDDICCYARKHFADIEIVVVSNGAHGQKQRQWLIENKANTCICGRGGLLIM